MESAPLPAEPSSLYSLLVGAAGSRLEASALSGPGGLSLSYAQLLAVVEAAARSLRRIGVHRSDPVVLISPSGAAGAAAFLALACCCVCAPLPSGLAVAALQARMRRIAPRLVILTGQDDEAAVEAACALGVPIVRLLESGDARLVVPASDSASSAALHSQPSVTPMSLDWGQGDDIALILPTSGTTGEPRLVPLSHVNLCAAANNIREVLRLTVADRCLVPMPLAHIHGLSLILASLASGGHVHVTGAFSQEGFLAAWQYLRPTWYSAAPAMHALVADWLQSRPDLLTRSCLRFIRSASGPIPRPLLERLEALFGVPLIEAYGMTEAGPQISSNRLPPERRKPGSVGRAAGPQIAIFDEHGQCLPPGQIGEVAISGINVMRAYLDAPASCLCSAVDAWLRTGDCGYLDEDGDLFLSGRLADRIQRGGSSIAPEPIEALLLSHPLVDDAVVFPVPHPVLGQLVTAAVVVVDLPQRRQSALIQELRSLVATHLEPAQVPQPLLLVRALPMQEGGKRRRRDLAEQFGLGQRPAAVEASFSEAERGLAALWSDVLGTSPRGPQDNFFLLGGHSLAASRLLARLEGKAGLTLPLAWVFEHPTLSDQAMDLGQRLAASLLLATAEPQVDGAASMPTIGQPESDWVPLAPAQQGLWLLDRLGQGRGYAMAMGWDLLGEIDPDALKASLQLVIERHESLRCVFRLVGDRPMQRALAVMPLPLAVIDGLDWDAETRARQLEVRAAQLRGAPFDLAQGPLLRVELIRLEPGHARLLVAVHHIAFDRWSAARFQLELLQAYAAITSGCLPCLPALPLTALQAARRLSDHLDPGRLRQRRDFWRQRLAGAPLLSTFPAQYPRPQQLSGQGASVRRPLAACLWERLEGLAQEQAVTPFMVILAAVQALLARYTDQRDVVIGCPHAQRSSPESEALIGCFATGVPLRSDLSGDPDFLSLLQRIKPDVLTAFDHADLTLDRLVELLQIPRSMSQAPVFQVMVAYQDLPWQPMREVGANLPCRFLPIDIEDQTAKFDLSLYFEVRDGERYVRWQYSTDLYRQDAILRLAHHFECLLERILAEPAQPLSRLTRLPDGEAERQVRLASGMRRPEFGACDVVGLIEAWAQQTPSAVALVAPVGSLPWGGTQSAASASGQIIEFSYCTLNQAANRLADVLRRCGYGPGLRIGLLLERTADAIICQLALLKLGICFVGLDPAHPRDRLRWMVADSELTTVLTTSEHASLLQIESLLLDELDADRAQGPADHLDLVHDPDSAAYLLYTSGSTGTPRGVLVSRANLSNYGPALAAELGVTPADRWLHTASFSFSSSVRQGLLPLMVGARVVMASTAQRSDPIALWRWIHEQGVSVVDLVPTHWRLCHAALAAMDDSDRQPWLAIPSLRLMLSASEPMPAVQPHQWAPWLERGVQLFNMYGQTETTGIVCVQRIELSTPARGGLMPIGRPIANLRCLVLDAEVQPAPMGSPGELWISGAGVGSGYWRQPELSAERFRADPFHPGEKIYRSGDRAVLLSDGRLHLLGRGDGQLKQGGVRIEPAELEAILLEEPGVLRAAVVASSEFPQDIMAYVEAVDADGTLHERLSRRLDQRLPAVMHPAALRIRERLPLTSNGKVDRAALARESGDDPGLPNRPISRRRYQAPRNRKEQLLANLWAEVLALPRVGIDDNFFDLGGDSLRSVRLVERAQASGLDLDLTSHFRYQTIGSLSDACWSEPALPKPVSVARPRPASPDPSSTPGGGMAGVMVQIEPLRAFGERLLQQVGLDAEGARIVTDVQLESSLRGQPTHNIDSLPRYARRLRSGTLNASPAFGIDDDGGIVIRVDGDNAPGQWVASLAMEMAIARAREQGICLLTTRRSNHYGAAGHYAWLAARQGLLGFTTTNGPVILAPTGGITPCLGNNPIGVGIPTHADPPILVDFAMTVAPRGRIALTVAQGNPLPQGWIFDHLGRPSTDLEDLAAGLGIPIGEHKGYGLAFVLEILSGVLSGSGFGLDHGRQLLGAYSGGADFGHFFLVVDPSLFLPKTHFLERVDRLISQAKASALAEGVDQILIPGERELKTRESNLARGSVFLSAHSWGQLQRYAEEADIPGLPDPIQAVEGLNS